MLTPSQVSRSLLVFVVCVIAAGVALGHALLGIGVAGFVFVLAAIEGKPSWRRIFDPDPKGEGGVWRFAMWKRLVPRPGDRDPTARR